MKTVIVRVRESFIGTQDSYLSTRNGLRNCVLWTEGAAILSKSARLRVSVIMINSTLNC